jgi:hypothetical protein
MLQISPARYSGEYKYNVPACQVILSIDNAIRLYQSGSWQCDRVTALLEYKSSFVSEGRIRHEQMLCCHASFWGASPKPATIRCQIAIFDFMLDAIAGIALIKRTATAAPARALRNAMNKEWSSCLSLIFITLFLSAFLSDITAYAIFSYAVAFDRN